MGITVKEFLESSIAKDMKILNGAKGIGHDIKGVTIIEAPDIVRFIEGGEVLLTGLYAFNSCTMTEFHQYILDLKQKEVAAIFVKLGRNVKEFDRKLSFLKNFTEDYNIPLIQVPFEVSFQVIMSYIMERLFNEEVTLLKYYKTTHDNFSALALSESDSAESILEILKMLEKLIQNPVSLYTDKMQCIATTRKDKPRLQLQKTALKYNPGIFSNHKYLRQEEENAQYIVEINYSFGRMMYLVIEEIKKAVNVMDCVAIENALIALQFEFSRQYALEELEKKFQNDIIHNLLYGTIDAAEELQKSAHLLSLDIEGNYRVLAIGLSDEDNAQLDLKEKLKILDDLEVSVKYCFKNSVIHRDLEKIVVICPINLAQKQQDFREELKEKASRIYYDMNSYNKYRKIRFGVGKIVDGLVMLQKSYKEAKDALMFVDIAGEGSEEQGYQIMLFSDLGIFKLLCQLDDPVMLIEYVPESLQKLYNYKKPQKNDLLLTLRTYLDRNQNLSKTSQELFIHYKTAAYRIDKIAKITGIDFNNANEVLAVRIGLVVYNMIENYQRKRYLK